MAVAPDEPPPGDAPPRAAPDGFANENFYGGQASTSGAANERFFGEAPRAPIANDQFFGQAAPDAERIDNDEFFRAPASPSSARVARTFWDLPLEPAKFGATLASLGLGAILFLPTDFIRALVVVAPVFEEALKFGVALLLVVALRAHATALRLGIALAPGVLFGVVEHYLTYSDETLDLFAGRVAFHAGTTALTMATWIALAQMPTWRHQWFATLPATVLHALNNALALVTAVFWLISGTQDQTMEAVLMLHAGITLAAFVATFVLVAQPERARRMARALAPRLGRDAAADAQTPVS